MQVSTKGFIFLADSNTVLEFQPFHPVMRSTPPSKVKIGLCGILETMNNSTFYNCKMLEQPSGRVLGSRLEWFLKGTIGATGYYMSGQWVRKG